MDELLAMNATYSPSWVNRFNHWVTRLPIPAWLFYTLFLIVWELIVLLSFWATGELRWGELDFVILFYNFWGVAILGFHYYLDSEIRDSLKDSKPLLNLSSGDFSQIELRFTIVPARPFLVWSIVGLGVGASASIYEGGVTPLSLSTLIQVLNFGIIVALFFGIAYRIVRLLKMISEVYASSIAINLFDLAPVYVLSALGAKVGLFLLILLYSSLALEPDSIADPLYVGGYALLSLLPLAAFFLPLRGINRRLVKEKGNLLSNISRRLVLVIEKIDLSFESGDLVRLGEFETALRVVQREKDLVEKIPTWPWRPATLRVLLSAVFLPIFLWLIQQVLNRLLDL